MQVTVTTGNTPGRRFLRWLRGFFSTPEPPYAIAKSALPPGAKNIRELGNNWTVFDLDLDVPRTFLVFCAHRYEGFQVAITELHPLQPQKPDYNEFSGQPPTTSENEVNQWPRPAKPTS